MGNINNFFNLYIKITVNIQKTLYILAFMLGIIIFCYGMENDSDANPHENTDFQGVKFIRNYDGDTITVNINKYCNYSVFCDEINVRLKNIDTPEIKGKTLCEIKQAQKAKDLLESTLSKSSKINLGNCGRDKYFRLLCDVEADGINVSQMLLHQGLAYEYHGGKKKKIDWCNTTT